MQFFRRPVRGLALRARQDRVAGGAGTRRRRDRAGARMRRYVVFAPGAFGGRDAKTAHGVIKPIRATRSSRWSIRSTRANACATSSTLSRVGCADRCERERRACNSRPTALLIGIAPPGGALPPAYRVGKSRVFATILTRGRQRAARVPQRRSGDCTALADAHDSPPSAGPPVSPPAAPPILRRRIRPSRSRIVLTVGSECAVSKMTTTLRTDPRRPGGRPGGRIRSDRADRDRDRRLGHGDRSRHRRFRQRRRRAVGARRRPAPRHRRRATSSS